MQPFPHGKHIFKVNILARDVAIWSFFRLFRIDDTSNGILLFLHSRRLRVKSISEFHCVVACRCWSRQCPSDAQMSVCVTFGAWWLLHVLTHCAACSNRTCFVMLSGPLCLRTQVLLCRGAHAYGMRRGSQACLDVAAAFFALGAVQT